MQVVAGVRPAVIRKVLSGFRTQPHLLNWSQVRREFRWSDARRALAGCQAVV